MYYLHQKVSKLRQGDQPLMEYYYTLWEEIDFYKKFQVWCTEDVALYNKEVEEI